MLAALAEGILVKGVEYNDTLKLLKVYIRDSSTSQAGTRVGGRQNASYPRADTTGMAYYSLPRT